MTVEPERASERSAPISSGLRDILAASVGQKIPGGCETCDAYQRMEGVDGVWLLRVYHDDWCSELARRESSTCAGNRSGDPRKRHPKGPR